MGLQGAAVPAVLQSPRAAPALEKAHIHLEGRELFVPALAHSCLTGHCLLGEGWHLHLVPGPQLRLCGSPAMAASVWLLSLWRGRRGVPFKFRMLFPLSFPREVCSTVVTREQPVSPQPPPHPRFHRDWGRT